MNSFQTIDPTKTELARISKSTCYALIIMFFLGVFAEFAVRNQLIDWNNAEATSMNIKNALMIFNIGILAWILIIVLDVYLAITFYLLFQRHDRFLSLLMATFRLVYVAVKGAVIVGLMLARDLSSLPADPASTWIDVLANQTMQLLKMHHYGFAIGLIFFGVHLILLGRILLKVSLVPKVIGMGVLVAGGGYLLNSLVTLSGVNANFVMNIVVVIFIIPMTFAELALGIWLYKRGVNLVAGESTV